MKHFLLIFLFCFQACWGDDYIAVQKRDVTYNFCKMNISWLDYFISCEFKGWEEDTFDTFDLVQNQDGVAIDLGAWIGTTAIYLCKNFKYVVAVEADKDSLKYLKKKSHCI